MKKSGNQIVFSGIPPTAAGHQEAEETKGEQASAAAPPTSIEFLPCLFQANVDQSNKAIYFDTIVRPAEAAHVPKGSAQNSDGQTQCK